MHGTNKAVRRNMRLRQDLIHQARRIPGTATQTETVEQSLKLVTFREEISEGIRRIVGSVSPRHIHTEQAQVRPHIVDSG